MIEIFQHTFPNFRNLFLRYTFVFATFRGFIYHYGLPGSQTPIAATILYTHIAWKELPSNKKHMKL